MQLSGSITSGAITSSASVIASGNSNSFGNTTVGALTASSISSSGSLSITGNTNSIGATTFTGAVVGTSFSAPSGFINGSNGGIRIHSSGTKFFNITSANAARDNIMDIGASDARFKDLYLGGNIQAAGNVGIGTTSPSGKIQVVNSGVAQLIIGYNGLSDNFYDADEHYFRTGDGTAQITVKKGEINVASDGGSGYVNSKIILNSTQNNARGAGIFMHNTNDDEEWYAGVPYSAGFGKYMIGHQSSVSSHSEDTAQETHAALIIEANGKTGIGEPDPASTLVVRSDSAGGRGGELTILNYATNTVGNEAALNFGLEDSTYNADLGNAQIKAKTNASNAATDMMFSLWSGSSFNERMRIHSSGNVGIGTTSPSANLEVAGDVLVASGEYISWGGVGETSIEGSTVSNKLQFRTGSADRMIINNTGVGIGTTSPSAKLDVRKSGTTTAQGDTDLFVGDSGAASSTAQVQIHGGTSGFSNLYFSDASAYNVGGFIYNHSSNYLATNVNGSERMRITSDGQIKTQNRNFAKESNYGYSSTYKALVLGSTGTNTSTNSTTVSINYDPSGNAYSGFSGDGREVLFRRGVQFVTPNSADDSMYLYNLVLKDGSVGIGTSSPSGLTHFYGNGASTYIVNQKNSTKWSEWHVGGTNHALIWDSTAAMRFMTTTSLNGGGASEKMRIDSSGRVGINETSLSGNDAKLIIDSGDGKHPAIKVNDGGANGFTMLADNYTATESQFNIGVGYSGGQGVISHNCKVSDAANNTFLSSNAQGATKPMALSFDAGDFIFRNTNTSATTAVDTAVTLTERMRIDSSGNVGIGTTSPDGILQVVDSGVSQLILGYNGNSINFFDGDSQRFRNAAGTERFRMYSNGDFHADGDVVAYSTSISDARLKDNVKPLESSLDKIMNLKGVEYIWNNGSRKGQKDIGFIAQEVEDVIPEIVREKEVLFDEDTKYKTVDYEKITAVLVEAVKELQQEMVELKNRLNNGSARIAKRT